jgi:hypothetical protein
MHAPRDGVLMARALVLALALFAVPVIVHAQGRGDTTTVAAKACCLLVRLPSADGIVTARETATGFTFRFQVKDRRVRVTLKIGQPVWADFAAKTVKLKATDVQPCCAIVSTPPPPSPAPAASALGSSAAVAVSPPGRDQP